MTGEQNEGRRRRDFELRDGLAVIDALGVHQGRDERVFIDQSSREADTLVEANEMRRGVDVDALARGLQHGAQEGDRGALAVGARDMDDRRQRAFGIAERIEQPLHAAERKIDCAGMKRKKPRENGAAAVHQMTLSGCLILRRAESPSRRMGRALGMCRPWFETRGFASLLTMRLWKTAFTRRRLPFREFPRRAPRPARRPRPRTWS